MKPYGVWLIVHSVKILDINYDSHSSLKWKKKSLPPFECSRVGSNWDSKLHLYSLTVLAQTMLTFRVERME